MNTTTERRASVPPLRFDWSRVFVPTTGLYVYVCQPHASVALQVWRAGNQSWQWLAVAILDGQPMILKRGSAGSLGRGKIAAESAIYRLNLSRAQLTVWDAVAAVADDGPAPF